MLMPLFMPIVGAFVHCRNKTSSSAYHLRHLPQSLFESSISSGRMVVCDAVYAYESLQEVRYAPPFLLYLKC